MKIFKQLALAVLCAGFLFSLTSCAVMVRKDNGKHKGWYKNSNNPHHPFSTNPGKAKGKYKRLK